MTHWPTTKFRPDEYNPLTDDEAPDDAKRTFEDYGMDGKAPATNLRPANNTPQSTTKPTPTNNQMNGSR